MMYEVHTRDGSVLISFAANKDACSSVNSK